jgi:hypothetical protein
MATVATGDREFKASADPEKAENFQPLVSSPILMSEPTPVLGGRIFADSSFFALLLRTWKPGSVGGMNTAIPKTNPEFDFRSTLGRGNQRQTPRLVLLAILLLCSCVSHARAGCTHAQPAGWYSQLRSDLPETIKASENARWSGLFEVIYEDGEFVYVAGASGNQPHLPRCSRDSEESLQQLAVHFGSPRPILTQALQFLAPFRFDHPHSHHSGENSSGQQLDGHLQLPEHPPKF